MLRHPLGTTIVRGGPPEPLSPLVLRLGLDGRGAGRFDLLPESDGRFRDSDLLRKVFEDDRRAPHGRGPARRRGVRGRCEHCQGRCQPAAQRTGQRVGLRGGKPCCAEVPGGSPTMLRSGCGNAGRAEVRLALWTRLHAWTGVNGGLAFFRLLHQLPDRPEACSLSSMSRQPTAEVTAQQRMIDRTQERFGLWPEWLTADTAYGSAENLAWLVHERGIEPHIPGVRQNPTSRVRLHRIRADRDICPAGKELRQRHKIYRVPRPIVDENGMMRYRASKLDRAEAAASERLLPRRSCVPSMKALAIWRATSPPPPGGLRCHLKA